MEYKYLLVGHGNFPQGVSSAIDLLLGGEDIIKYINLDEETTHSKFKENVTDFVSENKDKNIICFADINGGAPHLITSEVLNEKSKKWIMCSNVSVPFILEVCITDKSGDSFQTIQDILKESDFDIKLLTNKN